MKINGKELSLNQEMTLAEYLESQNYQLNRVAVERNGEIVPKATYGQIYLQDEDVLEVVSFVGGG